MPIVSSVVVRDSVTRRNGRRRITVHHTDHVGKIYRTRHLIGATDDVADVVAAAAAQLNASTGLAQDELQSLLEMSLEDQIDPHTITPDHNTSDAWLTYWLKKFANLNARSKWFFAFAQHMSTFTNQEIQTLLGEPIPQITEWRGYIQDFRAAHDTYNTHRIGPFPEVRDGSLRDDD